VSERPKDNGCGFLLLWAYLMVLSIALAPVVAQYIKQSLSEASQP
jgi:FtsH-binding integral membrane protein